MNHKRFLFVGLSITVLSVLLLFSAATTAAAAAVHPLDPLDESEITSAVRILQASSSFPRAALFSTVQLNEPPKTEVLSFKAGASFRREAFAIRRRLHRDVLQRASPDRARIRV